MSYCREGHTLIDNEAEAGWERLPPGSFFELVVLAVTYFGIVDEYIPPTPTTLVCRLYTDSGRTILHTVNIGTGSVYEINNGVDYLHDQLDLQLNSDGGMGIWRSPTVTIRDDTGVWGGEWIAEPKPDDLVQFNFDGTHTLFKVSVESPLATEVAGAGLGAGTFEYCIVPVDGSGRLGAGSRVLTVTLAGAADILIDWLPNTQVTTWNVYGRILGGAFGLMVNLPGATVSLVDDGTLVPNPSFLPPLFEDPAWTVAVANREQSGTDGDVVFDATGDEDGVNKNDDGSSVATFTAIGDVDADNIALNTTYLLTGLISHSNGRLDIVVDPTLFSNDTGPVESLPPKVTTYDYHVFVDSNGDTVIQEADSFTGQTTVIIVNTTDNTFDITISDSTGILATDTVPITPAFTIPTPGSMSAEITLSNFRTLTDGTIIADETMTANTYDVTPVAVAGIMLLMDNVFSVGTPRITYSLDGGLTAWPDFDPIPRITIPGGFGVEDSEFMWAHGHGWTVIATVDNGIPSLILDVAMHWTNDITIGSWPFNDAGGRVAGGDISAAQFARIQKNGTLTPPCDILRAANGLGPFMTFLPTSEHIGSTDEAMFFFPATGVMTMVDFVAEGGAALLSYTVWPEKNLFVGIDASDQIHTWILTTNEAAPFGAHSIPYTLLGSWDQTEYTFAHSPNRLFFNYQAGTNMRSAFTDSGISFAEVSHNTSSDKDTSAFPTLGMYSHHWACPRGLNRFIHVPASGAQTFPGRVIFHSAPTDGLVWVEETEKISGFFDSDHLDWMDIWSSTAFGVVNTPWFDDGIVLAKIGPTGVGINNSIARMDPDDFSDLTPANRALTSALQYSTNSLVFGSTIGSTGSPNGIPGANLRRYLGRSVVIPTGVANMPAPFSIRDTTKSAVYTSRRTKTRQVNYGGMRGTITEGPNGFNDVQVAVIENGQQIIINVPNSSDAIMAAKNPIPVNMRWSSVI